MHPRDSRPAIETSGYNPTGLEAAAVATIDRIIDTDSASVGGIVDLAKLVEPLAPAIVHLTEAHILTRSREESGVPPAYGEFELNKKLDLTTTRTENTTADKVAALDTIIVMTERFRGVGVKIADTHSRSDNYYKHATITVPSPRVIDYILSTGGVEGMYKSTLSIGLFSITASQWLRGDPNVTLVGANVEREPQYTGFYVNRLASVLNELRSATQYNLPASRINRATF